MCGTAQGLTGASLPFIPTHGDLLELSLFHGESSWLSAPELRCRGSGPCVLGCTETIGVHLATEGATCPQLKNRATSDSTGRRGCCEQLLNRVGRGLRADAQLRQDTAGVIVGQDPRGSPGSGCREIRAHGKAPEQHELRLCREGHAAT